VRPPTRHPGLTNVSTNAIADNPPPREIFVEAAAVSRLEHRPG